MQPVRRGRSVTAGRGAWGGVSLPNGFTSDQLADRDRLRVAKFDTKFRRIGR